MISMKRLVLALCLLAGSLWGETTPEGLVQKMQTKYRSLESLKASFTQTYRSNRFSETQTERGIAYFKRGGLMKWEYQEPEKKLFVSDGMFYMYYVAEDKQMVKTPVHASSNQHSPAQFLAGRGDFVKDFRAEWSDPRPGSHLLKLTPLNPQPDFRQLIVDVDPITGLILKLTVVDEYGNRTEYAFQQIQENVSLPSNFFNFVPPPGTDVIFERQETE